LIKVQIVEKLHISVNLNKFYHYLMKNTNLLLKKQKIRL
jgi:hypothetical protein